MFVEAVVRHSSLSDLEYERFRNLIKKRVAKQVSCVDDRRATRVDCVGVICYDVSAAD